MHLVRTCDLQRLFTGQTVDSRTHARANKLTLLFDHIKRWIKKEDALVAEGKDPKAAWPKWEAELFQKDYFKAASAVGSAFLEELEAKVGEMTQPRGITIGVVGKDSADPRDEATKAAGAMKGEVCSLLSLLVCFRVLSWLSFVLMLQSTVHVGTITRTRNLSHTLPYDG